MGKKRAGHRSWTQLVDANLLLAVDIVVKRWPVILNWQWDALIGIS